jgi:prepilin-type N-terminal cleavage/methylation domain-containing protein
MRVVQFRGFSLVEVLTATLILTLGIAAVARLFAYSAAVSVINERRTLATLLLHEKIEQLKAKPLSDPAWTPGEYSGYDGRYFHVLQISDSVPRVAKLVVYVRLNQRHGLLEMARTSAAVAP